MASLKQILNYRISEAELPKYRLGEIPKLALGAAIIGGGIYGIVNFLLKRKESDEIAAITEQRKQKEREEAARLASASRIATVRGDLSGWGQYNVGRGLRGGAGQKGRRGHYGH